MSKNPASFFLTEEIITKLTRRPDVTARHVGALLIIANHTGREGIYSTAGAYAVRRRLMIGDKRAQLVLQDLESFGVIESVENLHHSSKLRKEVPEGEGVRKVRWVVKPDNSRKIYFPKSIVEGVGKWEEPLADLRRCGDVPARLLMALYKYQDIPTYGGIDPTQTFFGSSELEEDLDGGKNITTTVDNNGFYHFVARRTCDTAWKSFVEEIGLALLGEDEGVPSEFWDAIKKLSKRGFIYETLTVFNGAKVEDGIEMLYPLHTFAKHSHPAKGEEPLSGLTAKLSGQHGRAVANHEGEFDGKTFAFFSEEEGAQMVGVYRLRFRDVSKMNHDNFDGWKWMLKSSEYWRNLFSEGIHEMQGNECVV